MEDTFKYNNISNVDERFTYEQVLKLVPPENIYYYYTKLVPDIRRKFLSPFKKENTPSFTFYFSDIGELRFKCWSSGFGGNCIELVKILYSLSGEEAVQKIAKDFKLKSGGNQSDNDDIPYVKIKGDFGESKAPAKIEVILRDFIDEDIIYWSQYGIDITDLEYYNIKPCREVWLRDQLYYSFDLDNPCYRYSISDKYKIYCPLSKNKKKKWLSNCKVNNVQGLSFLPESGDLLIITKSYKDIIVLNKYAGIDSIAFGSEGINLNEKIVKYFTDRFKKVIIFFDNDEEGIRYAKKQSENSGLDYIYIPASMDVKDPSELYREYGKEKFQEVISNLINV